MAASKTATKALFLSFVWPGLGQAYLGRRRSALIFAAPVGIVLLVLLWQARDGLAILLARVLLVPMTSLLLVIAAVLLAIWRLMSMAAAMNDVLTQTRRRGVRDQEAHRIGRQRALRLFAGLAVLVIASHGLVVWTGLAFYDAASKVYVTGDGSPGADPSDDVGVRPTPYATPHPGGRINILLIGADSGLGYSHSLTDTMILVSIDPKAKKVDMLSFPRDIGRVTLYSGGQYDFKLNSLTTYAEAHRDQFPDGGLGTLTREIGYLIGVPVHFYAFVDLAGFKAVIDAVGGIDIANPRDISDPGYQFPDGKVGFFLKAGTQHLDGRRALAYVRSRNGPGDNDFTRARRQQGLLVALRDKLTSATMLPKLPSILDALAATIQTDYPAQGVPDLIRLATEIADADVTHYVLGPPYANRPELETGTYMLVIDEKKFAGLSLRLFGEESRYSSAAVSPSP